MRAGRAPSVALAGVLALTVGACSDGSPPSESAEAKTGRGEPVSATPPQAPVVSCRDRIEYPDFEGDPHERKRDYHADSLRIGPVGLYPGRKQHPNFGDAAHLRPGSRELVFPVDPIVPAGKTVTLAVAPADRDRVQLGLEADGKPKGPAVTFEACPADQERFSGAGTLGSLTAFKEVLTVAGPGCATLSVYADGRRFERRVSFDVKRCTASSGG